MKRSYVVQIWVKHGVGWCDHKAFGSYARAAGVAFNMVKSGEKARVATRITFDGVAALRHSA